MSAEGRGTVEGRDAARARLGRHGGDIAAARAAFPLAPGPWIDLSTGINPVPYGLPPIEPAAWTALPGRDAERALAAAAERAYGARPGTVVAAPGTGALIAWLARLHPARRVGILDFTYGEHARAWRAGGAAVETVAAARDLAGFDAAVVVNPNNPDGRRVSPADLAAVARGVGLLVVDEAFADVEPRGLSLAPDPPGNVVVLRSFGKFYGLAGLRLGFAVAREPWAERLVEALGPWAVSGPALAIGTRALADDAWARDARARLADDAARLDALLEAAGFTVVGGTALFRLAAAPDAPARFEALARAGILARPFAARPEVLRFGLPGDAASWHRVAVALTVSTLDETAEL